MQRLSTTVVALVGHPTGPDGDGFLDAVAAAVNIHGVATGPDPPLDRAVAAWSEARRTRSTYTVHDADPLHDVAEAWAARWGGAGGAQPGVPGPVGAVEVATSDVVARWRAGSVELPDYYVVVDAASMDPLRRHWFLGVLRDRAPHRVALADADVGAVRRAIGGLPAGRWWPDLPQLLAGVADVVPDLPADPTSGESDREEPGGLVVG